MYYPCSESKGADQLRGYREADLCLCFRPSILLVFLCSGSYYRTEIRIGRQVGSNTDLDTEYGYMLIISTTKEKLNNLFCFKANITH